MALIKFIFLIISSQLVWTYDIQFNYFGTEVAVDSINCIDKPCTPGGFFCNENSTVVQSCINNQICDIKTCTEAAPVCCTAKCIPKTEVCISKDFQCMEAGAFPDPYNCTQFYCCNGPNDPETPTPTACAAELYYHPAGQCTSIKICNNTNKTVPDCIQDPSIPVQCGVLPLNPFIYYMCIADSSGYFKPYLFNCESGLFDPTNCICRGSSMSESVASVSCPSPSPTPPSPQCDEAYQLYPVDEDCHEYCRCLPSRNCQIETCIAGMCFSDEQKRCVSDNCDCSSKLA